jgi:hypothetical protein
LCIHSRKKLNIHPPYIWCSHWSLPNHSQRNESLCLHKDLDKMFIGISSPKTRNDSPQIDLFLQHSPKPHQEGFSWKVTANFKTYIGLQYLQCCKGSRTVNAPLGKPNEKSWKQEKTCKCDHLRA